jgi:hypothetical protein
MLVAAGLLALLFAATGAFGALLFATDFLPRLLADAFRVLFAVFFAVFFEAFLAVFLAAFLAFFAARFFAATFPVRFAAFPVFFFFEAFLATAKILVDSNETSEWGDGNAYRVASASIENTEKTSGFRSRL